MILISTSWSRNREPLLPGLWSATNVAVIRKMCRRTRIRTSNLWLSVPTQPIKLPRAPDTRTATFFSSYSETLAKRLDWSSSNKHPSHRFAQVSSREDSFRKSPLGQQRSPDVFLGKKDLSLCPCPGNRSMGRLCLTSQELSAHARLDQTVHRPSLPFFLFYTVSDLRDLIFERFTSFCYICKCNLLSIYYAVYPCQER